jgi:hypothetical protein
MIGDFYEKEVLFSKYCRSCKHEKCKETDEPCNECLSEPTNLYSHKPINWEEKEK